MTQSQVIPKRFYLLEFLRCLAILRVVVWHWGHFFSIFGMAGVKVSADQLPLYEVFYIFYKPYNAAIPFFFCISGFIFFWLYSKRVARKTISARSFFINRLSRLYPLHFVTLMLVLAGQFIYERMTHTYYIYPFNDLYHFILNVLLVPAWGMEKGLSFNGPVWLLSVMVLLYLIFFVFCRLFYRNIFALVSMVILGFFLAQHYNEFVGIGVKYFYLGGIFYVVYERIVKVGDPWKVSVWLPYLTLFLWLLSLVLSNPHVHFAPGIYPEAENFIFYNWPVFVLLPATILSVALRETFIGPIGKSLSSVGDIIFSIYLLHFPLQLFIAIIVVKLQIGSELFLSPWVMLLYLAVLVLLSLVSRRFFETPVQDYIRSRFLKGDR